jgi:hypothetical protein
MARPICTNQSRIWSSVYMTDITFKILAALTFANLLLVGDLRVQVPSISVVHDDAQALLVHEGFLVGDNVWVSHGLQDVDLFNLD